MTIRLDTKRGRDALKARKTPYFQKIRRGLSVGLRKLGEARGTWSARLFVGPGGNDFEWRVLGEFGESEAGAALTWEQAREGAEKWAAEVTGGVRQRDDAGKVPTVATACREYVEARRVEHKQGAHDADLMFRRHVYGHENPEGMAWPRPPEYPPQPIAAVELGKFRERTLRKWRDDFVAAGVAKSTVNRRLTHFKAALNHAVKTRTGPPALALEIAHVVCFENAGKRRDIFLEKAQRRALLKAAEKCVGLGGAGALRDLIEASALTGARPGELASMQRSAFDSRTASLTLGGKTGKRTVPLSPPAAALFSRLAKSKLPTAPLLARSDGARWQHSDWDELIREAAAAAELPKGVVLYSLRHAFITEALLGGMATLSVARLVGTSVQMIEKHYGHLVAGHAREGLAAFAML